MNCAKCATVALMLISSAAPALAQQLYEPLIDQDARGFKPAKYERDLAYCRNRAAPHAAAANEGARQAAEGASQASAGAALSAVGNAARFMPVPGLGAANGLWAGGTAADIAGGAIGAQGAAASAEGAYAADAAAGDYALVVDACLRRRGYKMLR